MEVQLFQHAREVRDLLGGDYFFETADENRPDGYRAELGDIIAYWNHNTVDWLGFFAQGNYTKDALSAYGTVGFSSVTYTHQNHFLAGDPKFEADPITGTALNMDIASPRSYITPALNCIAVIGSASNLGSPARK